MKAAWGTLVLAAFMAACSAADSTSEPVVLDGLFDEWSGAATLVDDPPDAADSAVDLLSIQALDDPRWLYLAMDVGNEVALQGLPGTLHLLFDVDADVGTGGSVDGMDGVDLIVDLSQVPSPLGGGRRAGFGVRSVGDGGETREVSRNEIGLMAAPTWAAPRFELRLSRLGADAAPAFGSRLRMKAVYREQGPALDETEVSSYQFLARPARPGAEAHGPADAASRFDRAPEALRVAAWNVSSGSFTRRREGFARVLAALRPDVILLDEIPTDVTHEWLVSFFDLPGLRDLGSWAVVLGQTGRAQRAAVAARQDMGELRSAFSTVSYPQRRLESLVSTTTDAFRTYLEGEAEAGVSAAGAWLEIDGERVLFVAVDLQSGGWPGSPGDHLRAVQAAAIHTRVTEALGSAPAPVVIGGDLNLVGSRTPLFSLVRGLDVDGSDLAPVDALRLGERTLATWRAPRDVFAPGRLDFLLVPDAFTTVANSFVFATEDLDDATLQRIGLERDLMLSMSDHLVVVADLRFGVAAPLAEP